MDLQNKKLKELDDWLTKTEERTRKMEEEPLGPDLEDLKRQVQQHKVCEFCYICFLIESRHCMHVHTTYTQQRLPRIAVHRGRASHKEHFKKILSDSFAVSI